MSKNKLIILSFLVALISISIASVVTSYDINVFNDNVVVTIQPDPCTRGCTLEVMVTVKDDEGNPVNQETVKPVIYDSQGGTVIDLGARDTDANGIARWTVATNVPWQGVNPWPAGTYTAEFTTFNYDVVSVDFVLRERVNLWRCIRKFFKDICPFQGTK